ncbi:MAG: aromatic ring-opening dioxygenase subunit LigB [Chloroflexota bacterium]|nr:aromatic ring-opening dioxygenase subunit LigB [Chloroflexota bacterium]
MPLVFAAIAPHGFPIIPDLSDDAEGALATREAMLELGRRCADAGPDAVVVAGPHGVRVDGAICLADVARAAGTLRWHGRQVEMNVPVDGPLTDAVADAARARGVPIALAGFAGNRRFQAAMPLDWGTITPLWFLGHDRNLEGKGDVLAPPPDEDVGPPAVIVTPSRSLPRETMVEFGRAVADAAAGERRVAFVASCDWAHTHRDDGPYGFHPAAAEVDGAVVAAVRDGDLLRLIDLPQVDVEHAAIDGLWQTLMLGGLLERVPMRHDLLAYEAPSYYGMLVAAYEPAGNPSG